MKSTKKGKIIFSSVLLPLLLLCSCNPKPGEEHGENEALKPFFGWRSAGLMPNLDSLKKWGTGFTAIAHSKDYIFVMDSKVENPQTRVTAYRIFMSKQGSEKWEELETPSELSPFNMYGDASGLYVGFHRNGQLWHYKPDSKKWTNLFKMELTAKQSYTVYGIAEFEGRIVASIAGYNNIENTDTYDATGLILHMQPDGTLKNIAPPDELEIWFRNYNRVPLHFTDAAEWRGKLFVSSAECGIWVYDNASWQKLPEYEEKDSPYVIELHKDRLYVGQYAYGGVQEIQNVIPEFRWIAILQLMAVIEKGHRYMSRH